MNRHRPLTLLFTLLMAGASQAHPGHGELDFWTGLLHPLTGIDHVLAMFAVGLWAAFRELRSPRHVAALPLLFVAGAALGTGLGLAGALNAGIEIAVAVSLLPLGLALMLGVRGSHLVALCLVPVCGLLHGGAHGHELSGPANGGAIVGFLLGTTLLHAAGAAAVLALPSARRRGAMAGAGGALAAATVWLLA